MIVENHLKQKCNNFVFDFKFAVFLLTNILPILKNHKNMAKYIFAFLLLYISPHSDLFGVCGHPWYFTLGGFPR